MSYNNYYPCTLDKCTLFLPQANKFTRYLSNTQSCSCGTPVASTTETSRHDLAENLLNVVQHK